MYHLLPLRRGTAIELGNPDTMLARKAQDWVSSPTCRNLDLPFQGERQSRPLPHRNAPGAHASHGVLPSPSRHDRCAWIPAARETLDYCSGYLLCRFLEIKDWQGLACLASIIISRHFHIQMQVLIRKPACFRWGRLEKLFNRLAKYQHTPSASTRPTATPKAGPRPEAA